MAEFKLDISRVGLGFSTHASLGLGGASEELTFAEDGQTVIRLRRLKTGAGVRAGVGVGIVQHTKVDLGVMTTEAYGKLPWPKASIGGHLGFLFHTVDVDNESGSQTVNSLHAGAAVGISGVIGTDSVARLQIAGGTMAISETGVFGIALAGGLQGPIGFTRTESLGNLQRTTHINAGVSAAFMIGNGRTSDGIIETQAGFLDPRYASQ